VGQQQCDFCRPVKHVEKTHDLFVSNFDSLLKKIYDRSVLRFVKGMLTRRQAIGTVRIHRQTIDKRTVLDVGCILSLFDRGSRVGNGNGG
jgi:hypothetical protein